mgnify:CR=1 FL=1
MSFRHVHHVYTLGTPVVVLGFMARLPEDHYAYIRNNHFNVGFHSLIYVFNGYAWVFSFGSVKKVGFSS